MNLFLGYRVRSWLGGFVTRTEWEADTITEQRNGFATETVMVGQSVVWNIGSVAFRVDDAPFATTMLFGTRMGTATRLSFTHAGRRWTIQHRDTPQ